MSQGRFQAALDFVLKWEGSEFTNDPDDHGGATRFGITQSEYDRFRLRLGAVNQSVKFISRDEVRTIYLEEYWTPLNCETTPAPVDLVMFDTSVLMGSGRAITLLRTAVGPEGIKDFQIHGVLPGVDSLTIARTIIDGREKRLRAIVAADPSQQKFLRGWLNRLNDLRRVVGIAAPGTAPSGSEILEGQEPGSAVGRADRDLHDDEQGDGVPPGGPPTSGLTLLQKLDVSSFLAGASRLSEGATAVPYVIEVPPASGISLRAFDPGVGPQGSFDIPRIAIDTITPLGIYGANPTRFLTLVTFRPGYSSLAAAFRQLARGEASPPGVGPIPEPVGRNHVDANDPAAPLMGELNEITDLATARILANLGTFSESEPAAPGAGAAPTMPLDIGVADAFLNACETSNPRVTYGLGAKAPFFGAVPGRDFTRIDCSGFVREAIRRGTNPRVAFPDGSVVQHDWVRQRGFARTTVASGTSHDGAVRIAFLSPQDTASHIGHVVLIHNGRTLESHGGVGPDARAWTGDSWQGKSSLYVLTP